MLVAGAAWAGLLLWTITASASSATSGTAAAHLEMAPSHDHAFGAWTGMWTLMVIAMMWPLWSDRAAAVAAMTFRCWRTAAVAALMVTLTALWVGVGVVLRPVVDALTDGWPSWVWPVSWLAIAVVLTRSLWRARLLRACDRSRLVIAPQGWRATATSAQAGWLGWPRCALLCGPVMVAMLSTHQWALMVGGSVAVWWEQAHPRAWRDPVRSRSSPRPPCSWSLGSAYRSAPANRISKTPTTTGGRRRWVKRSPSSS